MGDAMDKEFDCRECCFYEIHATLSPCCECSKIGGSSDCFMPADADVEEDVVNHPPHYTDHPSGIECIQITEHMNFCLGNAIKYLWRAGLKGDAVEDMEKAIWYINREIERRKAYGDDDTTT